MTLRAILLDFDGVILESNAAKTEAFSEIFSRFPEHYDAMMRFHHQNAWASRYLKFDHLVFERLGRTTDVKLRDELVREFSVKTLKLLESVPFVSGARDFLDEFGPLLPLAVISVTPQPDLEAVVVRRGAARFLSGVYGCPPWTKVTAGLDFLGARRIPIDSAVLIGDAPGDEQAAREIGCEFVCRGSEIQFDKPMRCFGDMLGVAGFLRKRLTV